MGRLGSAAERNPDFATPDCRARPHLDWKILSQPRYPNKRELEKKGCRLFFVFQSSVAELRFYEAWRLIRRL